jgi:hypothetical protein
MKMVSPSVPNAVGASDDWPSHTQELTRKTSEQLQIWSDRFDAGTITPKTMLCVVATLYDTTSGLIERDLSTLLANIHRDLMRSLQKAS